MGSVPVVGDLQASNVVAASTFNVAGNFIQGGASARPGDTTNFPSAGVSKNDNFVGRTRELQLLHQKLARGAVAVFHAVTSDGGFGKSQLVVEYAFVHRDDYEGVWFINAASPDADGRNILIALGETPPQESAAIAAFVSQRLSRGRHLLILDDVSDPPAAIKRYALSGTARLLITTRRNVLAGEGFEPFPLDVLEPGDAVDLLKQGRPDLRGPQHHAGLLAVAHHLHCHALAVALAGGYLRRHPSLSLVELLDRLKSAPIGSKADILEGVPPKSAAAGYRLSVAASLALSLPTLGAPTDDADRLRQTLLAAASLLDPRSIPPGLLLAVVSGDEATAGDVDAALLALVDVCILRYGAGDARALLNIHGLTQQLVRSRLAATEEGAAILRASADRLRDVLRAQFTIEANEDPSQWPRLDRLAPHSEALLRVDHGRHADPAWASLCNQVGYFADNARHRLGDALRLFEEAERIDRAAVGPDHPSVATRVNNVGGVLYARGDLDGALAKYKEAERIDRTALGPDHPSVSIRVNNVGGVLHARGDLDGALAKYEEAERIDRAALGPDHPSVAMRVNNVGSVLHARGDLAGALAKFEEAERIDRAAFGPDHPSVARDVNNVGSVLHARGDLVEALAKYEEAERIDRAAFGPDHPQLATDINNVGSVLHDRGDKAGALAKFEESFSILLKAYGPRGENVVPAAGNVIAAGGDPIAQARAVAGEGAARELIEGLMALIRIGS